MPAQTESATTKPAEQESEPSPQYPVAPQQADESTLSQQDEAESPGEEVQTTLEAPLPPLDQSDATLLDALDDSIAGTSFEELFIPQSLIRHFVVTVDNLTRSKLPKKYSLTQPAPGNFLVQETEDNHYRIDPANYARYERFVQMVETMSLDQMVDIYTRYYPLFQQAYEDLGYPERYFNDRLVEVIDHLLALPEIERPIEFVQPKVFYKFSEPQLESLSAGRKLLLRMGPDNAARIQTRLRELRERLISLSSPTG